MTKIIFVPGLGADERLFELLQLKDLDCIFLKWVNPEKSPDISSYVGLLKQQLPFLAEPPVLVGVSLGGIVAMEWRRLFPVKKTILISSVKCRNEMPGYFNLFETLHVHKLVNPFFLKHANVLIKPLISDTTNKRAMELFSAMLKDANDDFIKWGLEMVVKWKQQDFEKSNLIHIHGTADHVFPLSKIVSPDYVIAGGRHDMILSNAIEISKILMKELV